MSKDEEPEWVVPARIPFAALKENDLEQCVYWLLDAMGAKDLDWRKGSETGGAADGGRDLEATFYHPDEGGALVAKKWWVECKGRADTVARSDVQGAAVNAMARTDVDTLVVATNTTFTNPTRDWVETWNSNRPRPKIQLWDKVTLERHLSRQPTVVLRLFGEALSLNGRLRAAQERFWNRLEYVPTGTLESLWKGRETIEFNDMAIFALVVNEFAAGSITERPWAGRLDSSGRLAALEIGLLNTPYLFLRTQTAGERSQPIIRALAYLILAAMERYRAPELANLVLDIAGRRGDTIFPKHVVELLLLPVLEQLQSELGDVCSADCDRISSLRRTLKSQEGDEIEAYWQRLRSQGTTPPKEPTSFVRLERLDAPCVVGFPVSKSVSCPLFEIDPSVDNVEELLVVLDRVATFRNHATQIQEGEDASPRPRE